MIRNGLDVDRFEVIQVLASVIFFQHFDVGSTRQGCGTGVGHRNRKS
jgi:hypothetical protein